MRAKKEFPGIPELFQLLTKRCGGGLDCLKEERFRGNLEPTEIAIGILSHYIETSPIESVVRNVFSIKLLLGEEDCNTELLQGVEKAIRARQEAETTKGNHKVAMQLSVQTLRLLIQDSVEINKSMVESPK
ncbi:hypothetical protein Lgra_2037 [Legionella gratiana]|uniref:Uncharacterized protein n=1 Tax=Legionella gratiana TaxID=45066 RepID=A0A378JIS1_9GAMM|nr:hypothetical protein [Legionella gratiana]KTD11071.1 hypothetical protein Lgra_2037 [Legionella gratiana]STX44570.1 Uncharacterised protein [Legionella gratiana]